LIAYLHNQVGGELDGIPLDMLLRMDLMIVELLAVAMSRCRAKAPTEDVVIHIGAGAKHVYNDTHLRKFMIDYVRDMTVV
jgi:hypothetical protein